MPFIARYRKEATGGLDDTQLRLLAERLVYVSELEERRDTILEHSRAGQADARSRGAIAAGATKAELEDLYLPYKPKRRTRAEIARERGLEPLARGDPVGPLARAWGGGKGLSTEDVEDVKAALEGARDMLGETLAEDAELGRPPARLPEGQGVAARERDRGQAGGRREILRLFRLCRALGPIPSHRALAMLRGRNEGVLSLEHRGRRRATPRP